jgi:hypothetical protein
VDIKTIFASIFVIFTLMACDSGIFYAPSDWVFSGSEWGKTFGVAELRVRTIGNLTGAKFAALEMSVENHSSSDTILVKNVTLETGKGRYPAEVRIGSIRHGLRTTGSLFWNFKEPVKEIFVEPVKLSIILEVGQEEKSLDIALTRFPKK